MFVYKMENLPETDNFFGVYLLVSQSIMTKFKGKTYIGYTVDPNRRIRQHNKGRAAGGAWKTSSRGPWAMAMIIHGFPNNISALRFEWAWQQPKVSRRLNQIPSLQAKKRNETHFDYSFRIFCEMLRMGPWNRLSLCVRWITNDYFKEFPPDRQPPMHMEICFGRIKIKRISNKNLVCATDEFNDSNNTIILCAICADAILCEAEKITCINSKCCMISHLYCLAEYFIAGGTGHYLPIEGDCPNCGKHYLWSKLILKKKNQIFDLVNCDENEEANIYEDEMNEYEDDVRACDYNFLSQI